MNIHTGTITNIDRVALSNELYEIADTFALEAILWTAEDAHTECKRIARKLAEIARGVVSGAADYGKAEAFRDAAKVVLGNVTGARRFFDSLATPPNRMKGTDRD